jgi:hypothetical protein
LWLLQCRRISDQRDEAASLQGQVSDLQAALAASHAAHLALKQHHSSSMEAWAAEKKGMEQQHRQEMMVLKQVRVHLGAQPLVL